MQEHLTLAFRIASINFQRISIAQVELIWTLRSLTLEKPPVPEAPLSTNFADTSLPIDFQCSRHFPSAVRHGIASIFGRHAECACYYPWLHSTATNVPVQWGHGDRNLVKPTRCEGIGTFTMFAWHDSGKEWAAWIGLAIIEILVGESNR